MSPEKGEGEGEGDGGMGVHTPHGGVDDNIRVRPPAPPEPWQADRPMQEKGQDKYQQPDELMVEGRLGLVDLSFPLHVMGGVCQTGQEKDASSQILD